MNPPDPHPRAVALRYDEADSSAPRLLAKGQGQTAHQIEALATRHGIPLHHDPDLVELLSATPLGDEIPEDLYTAVARLLTFLWGLRAA